jgi:hypothetical protein
MALTKEKENTLKNADAMLGKKGGYGKTKN